MSTEHSTPRSTFDISSDAYDIGVTLDTGFRLLYDSFEGLTTTDPEYLEQLIHNVYFVVDSLRVQADRAKKIGDELHEIHIAQKKAAESEAVPA